MVAKLTSQAAKRRKRHLFRYRVACPCIYCARFIGFKSATIEHLVRRCDGGTNRRGNLYISCEKCNSKREERSIKEWRDIRSRGKVIPDLIIFIENRDQVSHE
jgi:5-methylcytosine-specific restriction endonuclease McrA